MTHLTTPELIRALGGADAICKAGCSCRGSYAGPERRSVARHPAKRIGSHPVPCRIVWCKRKACREATAAPCRYCAGTGTLVYQDEAQPCYCQQVDADVAVKT